ncbi:SDR family oxidoreductase [Akkermansiaceae bacterium]|nr:SDR family oxidoreductase [Akkermansiaceae bacterium]
MSQDGQASIQARQYKCALITGASSGLGEEYAHQLAPSCDSMILVARREELLNTLATELKAAYPHIELYCAPVDLSTHDQRIGFINMIQERGLKPDLLVNNAGMGDYGTFTSAEWSKLDDMIQVNMTALTHLCHGFLPDMIEGGRGSIINVSSLASMLPIPDFAVYAATKAYVTSFSEALRLEVNDFGINIVAVCPGPVRTGFGKIAMREGAADKLPAREGFYTTKEQVVFDSIIALEANKARVFPNWKIAAMAAGISLLPMAILRLALVSRRETSQSE